VDYWKILNNKNQMSTLDAVESYSLEKERLAAGAKFKREHGAADKITAEEQKAVNDLATSGGSGLRYSAKQFEKISMEDRIKAIQAEEAHLDITDPTRTDKLSFEDIKKRAEKEFEKQEEGKNIDFNLAKQLWLKHPDTFTGTTEEKAAKRKKLEDQTDFGFVEFTREQALNFLRTGVGDELTADFSRASGPSEVYNHATRTLEATDPLKKLRDKNLAVLRDTAAREKKHSEEMASIRRDVHKSRARLFRVIYDEKLGRERPMTADEIKQMETKGVGSLFGEKAEGVEKAGETEGTGTFKSSAQTRKERLAKKKHARESAAAQRKLDTATNLNPLAESLEAVAAVEDQMAQVRDDKEDKEPELTSAMDAWRAANAHLNNVKAPHRKDGKMYSEADLNKAQKNADDALEALQAAKTEMEKLDNKTTLLEADRVKAVQKVNDLKLKMAEDVAKTADRWDEAGHKKKLRMMQLEGKTSREIADEKFKYESAKLQDMEQEYALFYKASYADGVIDANEYKKLQEMYGELKAQYGSTDDAAFGTITKGGGGVVSQLGKVGGGMALGGEANLGKRQYDELRKANGFLDRIEKSLTGNYRDSNGIFVPNIYPSDAKPK